MGQMWSMLRQQQMSIHPTVGLPASGVPRLRVRAISNSAKSLFLSGAGVEPDRTGVGHRLRHGVCPFHFFCRDGLTVLSQTQ